MKNISYTSHFSRLLARQGYLNDNPLQVVDVGARGGPQSHWPLYGKHVNVIGFEPYTEEAERLNLQAQTGKFLVPFTCYPVALGNSNGTTRLYEYSYNKAANSLIPPENDTAAQYRDITIRRFDDFTAEHNIESVDFMKIDVEGHELSVIEGLGKFLDTGGILGFEIEVHFKAKAGAVMFSDIEILMRRHGYQLYDVDIFRSSSMALPSIVAWDHRDHNNQPILGPTISGRVVHGDALFFKDIQPEKEAILKSNNYARILKMVSLFEVYGLPDCAVELLEEYRSLIDPIVPVDTLLNAFVPDHYGKDLSYKQYLQAYHRHVGRVPDSRKSSSKSLTICQAFLKCMKLT